MNDPLRPAAPAWASTMTEADAGSPADSCLGPATAPALRPPTWSGRKTAIAAALAIGLSSAAGIRSPMSLHALLGACGGWRRRAGQTAHRMARQTAHRMARHTAYEMVVATPRKDLSLLPVCGGLRPAQVRAPASPSTTASPRALRGS